MIVLNQALIPNPLSPCYPSPMSNSYSLLEAWQAHEAGQYELAATIWKALIEVAPDVDTRRNLVSGYCETLAAQGKSGEARALLQQLHAETGEPRFLHQLGLLERQTGHPAEALAAFDAEHRLLDAGDSWSLAANAAQRSLAALESGDMRYALACAEEGLPAARACGDAGLEANAHALLGQIAEAMGLAQRARECYADAAVAYASAGDEAGEQEMAARIARI